MRARGKPGRPIGSKTFRETPAVKRARVFLEKKHAGLKPNAAARAVAADWQVSESTVFKDYERHLSRLIGDAGISDALSQTARPDLERLVVKAEAAAVAAKRRLRNLEIKIGRTFLMDHPSIAAEFSRLYLIEFRRVQDELAQRLEAEGNVAGVQAVRAFDPENAMNGDVWLALLGQQYLALLRHNKATR
jgi:hypothetical protein